MLSSKTPGIRKIITISLGSMSETPIFRRMDEENQRRTLKQEMSVIKTNLVEEHDRTIVNNITDGYRQQMNENFPIFLKHIRKFGRRYHKESNQNG